MQPITSCNNCLLAEKTTIASFSSSFSRHQSGCKVGRIDKFRERGAQVERVTSETGNSYFTIDRPCNAKLYLDTPISPEEAAERIDEHTRLGFAGIVLADYLTANSLEEAKASLLSFWAQTQAPQVVFIILNDEDLREALLGYLEAHAKGRWEIKDLKTPTAEQREAYPYASWRGIDEAVADCGKRYVVDWYAKVEAGDCVPVDLFAKMDHQVNRELRPWVAVMGEGGGALLVNREAHRAVGGCVGEHVDVKLASLARLEQGVEVGSLRELQLGV